MTGASGTVPILISLWTLCTVCWSPVSGQAHDPKVNITYTEPASQDQVVRGYLAEDVVLNCDAENKPVGRDVRWNRITRLPNEEPQVTVISQDTGVTDNMKWSIETPSTNSWRLRIKSLQLTDEANYTCFIILSGHNNRVESNRTVLVHDPPRIISAVSSSDTTIKEGDKVELKCNSSGIPTPTLIWRREGNAILPESSGGGVERLGGILDISEVSYLDRGRYFCRALNEMGEHRWEVYLTVTFPPKISVNSERVGQAVGYQRTLKCYVEANPPVPLEGEYPSLTWMKGNTYVPDEPEKREVRVMVGAYGKLTFELRIFAVEQDDYGMYTCIATNSQGENTQELELYETDEPQSDDQGQNSGPRAATLSIATLITFIVVTFLHLCKS